MHLLRTVVVPPTSAAVNTGTVGRATGTAAPDTKPVRATPRPVTG